MSYDRHLTINDPYMRFDIAASKRTANVALILTYHIIVGDELKANEWLHESGPQPMVSASIRPPDQVGYNAFSSICTFKSKP